MIDNVKFPLKALKVIPWLEVAPTIVKDFGKTTLLEKKSWW